MRLGLGGEWGGAAVENAPPHRKNTWGMFPPLGAPWSGVLVIGWCSTRRSSCGLAHPVPAQRDPGRVGPAAQADGDARLPRSGGYRGTAQGADCYASHATSPRDASGYVRGHRMLRAVYLATAFALGYGTKTLGYSREAFLGVELVAILVPGGRRDRGQRARGPASPQTNVLAIGFAGCIGVGALMGPMLGGFLLPQPRGWSVCRDGVRLRTSRGGRRSLFPWGCATTGVSMTFNLGGVLGGGAADRRRWQAPMGCGRRRVSDGGRGAEPWWAIDPRPQQERSPASAGRRLYVDTGCSKASAAPCRARAWTSKPASSTTSAFAVSRLIHVAGPDEPAAACRARPARARAQRADPSKSRQAASGPSAITDVARTSPRISSSGPSQRVDRQLVRFY